MYRIAKHVEPFLESYYDTKHVSLSTCEENGKLVFRIRSTHPILDGQTFRVSFPRDLDGKIQRTPTDLVEQHFIDTLCSYVHMNYEALTTNKYRR